MVNDAQTLSDKARLDILAAALKHVPFDGWTDKTLRAAVNELDLPIGSEELYFPGGAKELIGFWAFQGDQAALEIIRLRGLDNLRIREKITECVWIRLSGMGGHEDAARRAMARVSLPGMVGQGPKMLWNTADMIWRAIGDTSTDVNYYSKRTILSSVLGSSIVAWLDDESDDKGKARAFLEARIENVMQFEKVKAGARRQRANLPDPIGMLGRLRYGRRRRRYR